ncbi:MAG: hypothetical protein KDD34_05520 [Bdellovibrionales bacterium]|nr:hypothetical protein [Bdellovibrionales bacterium]
MPHFFKKKNFVKRVVRYGIVWAFGAIILVGFMPEYSYAFESDNSQVQQCIQDICGADTSVAQSASGDGPLQKIIPQNIKEDFETQVTPILSEIVDQDLKTAQMTLDFWKELKAEKSLPPLTDNQKILLFFNLFVRLDWDGLSNAYEYDENQNLNLNRNKALPLLSSFTAEKAELIIKIFNAWYGDDKIKRANSLDGKTFEQAIRFLAGGKEYLPWFVDRLLEKNKVIEQAFGMYLVDATDLKILEKIKKDTQLTPYEKTTFLRVTAKILRVNTLAAMEHPVRNFILQFSLSWNDLFENKKLDEEIKTIESQIVKKKNTIKSEAVEFCHKKAYSFIASSPSALRVRQMEKLTQQVLKSAQEVLPKYFLGQTLETAQNSLKEITFHFPDNYGTAIDKLQTYIKSKNSSLRGKVEYFEKGDFDLKIKLLLISLINRSSDEDDLVEMILPDTFKTCNSLQPPSLSDSAIPTSPPSIDMSWQSTMWPGYGANILAHEIGHVIYHATNDGEALTSVRQCNKDQHSQIYGNQAINDGRHDDEDWADTFSLSVQKHLDPKGFVRNKNFACLLLPVSEKTKNPIDNVSLVEDLTESHSSSLFRLLKIESETRGLPASCKSLPQLQGKDLKSCSQ